MQSEVTLGMLPPHLYLPLHLCAFTGEVGLNLAVLSGLLPYLCSSSHPLLPAPAILLSPLHTQWFPFHGIIPIHRYFSFT